MSYQATIVSQYNAALAMLAGAIQKCPDELWNRAQDRNRFWRVAYHALFYTHLYLQDRYEDFAFWDKHRAEYQLDAGSDDTSQSRLDAVVCSKSDVLEYVDFCRRLVANKVPRLDLDAASGFHWLTFNKFELQLYTIRHIQQHAGELSERLGPDAGIDWVGSVQAQASSVTG